MPWLQKKTRKENTSFIELAPAGLCDIHAHILPGLDDGAQNLSETLEMLKGMAELGYTLIVATPHFNLASMSPRQGDQQSLIAEIQDHHGLTGLRILPGAEIEFNEVFLAEEKTGKIPRIGSERTYLVEFGFSPGSVPLGIADVFFRFRAQGGNLIVAHPERAPDFQSNPHKIDQLRHLGALVQVDLTSLSGRYGATVERMARKLIEEGRADLVASDIHQPADLKRLSRTLEELAKRDEISFVRLASTHPHLIAAGRFDEVEQNA